MEEPENIDEVDQVDERKPDPDLDESQLPNDQSIIEPI